MWKLGIFALAGALLAGEAAACEDSAPAVSPARSKANLASLIFDEDYPIAARDAREQGMVEFTLDVGANGRAMACQVTRSSGSAALDDTTCRLMRSRARFTPALDASGTPTADKMTGRIVWRL